MAFFILWFSVFEVLARATYKTIFATFLREFFLKLASAAGLLLVLFGYMNFSSFLIYYIVIYGLICLFLLLQLVTSGEFKRSEEHTSELQSLMRISYAVFCLKKKKKNITK